MEPHRISWNHQVSENCYNYKADSRFAPSQWETTLLCNGVSHWLGANLESALNCHCSLSLLQGHMLSFVFICLWISLCVLYPASILACVNWSMFHKWMAQYKRDITPLLMHWGYMSFALTHCGLVMLYGDRDLVNFGSGNGLLPDGTKPLPEPMLTDHQWSPSDIHIRAISQEMPQPSITEFRLKITYLNFHSNFPGASELNNQNGLCSPG